MGALEVILVTLYVVSMVFVVLFSLGQLHLALMYRREHLKPPAKKTENLDRHRTVTVQLPVYNERFVIERLLDAVTALEWPADKLEIQVLDDSDDGTSEIISRRIDQMSDRKVRIRHIRRKSRTGYKAGALQNGLRYAEGEFIAIFDADFLPRKDFLQHVLPFFSDDLTGMVQVRWGHLNKDYSLLTRIQAFGLDGHFSVEQTGRQSAGSFINFNGTGGMWRKSCIYDAGGWQEDTIAEDLDLSYRAQLRGWKFRYVEHIDAPAELPVEMSAVKSQQFRWTKGGAETARKNLLKILRSGMRPVNMMHAFFHLTNSTNFLFILIASLVSIPLLFIKSNNPDYAMLFHATSVFLAGFIAIAWFYWTATKHSDEKPCRHFIQYFPLFILFYMGLAFHNSLAVVEGLAGKKSPFIRTPKYNIIGVADRHRLDANIRPAIGILTVIEAVLCLYFVFGIAAAFLLGDYGLLAFHGMLAAGYGMMVYYSIRQA